RAGHGGPAKDQQPGLGGALLRALQLFGPDPPVAGIGAPAANLPPRRGRHPVVFNRRQGQWLRSTDMSTTGLRAFTACSLLFLAQTCWAAALVPPSGYYQAVQQDDDKPERCDSVPPPHT